MSTWLSVTRYSVSKLVGGGKMLYPRPPPTRAVPRLPKAPARSMLGIVDGEVRERT